jgi:hypothetical protein
MGTGRLALGIPVFGSTTRRRRRTVDGIGIGSWLKVVCEILVGFSSAMPNAPAPAAVDEFGRKCPCAKMLGPLTGSTMFDCAGVRFIDEYGAILESRTTGPAGASDAGTGTPGVAVVALATCPTAPAGGFDVLAV